MIEWRWLGLFAIGSVTMPFLGVPMALCTIAHELGHAAAARRAGVRVLSVELRVGHGLCVHEHVEDPRKQLRIALAGPIAHALFAVSLAIVIEVVRLAVVAPRSLDTVLFLSARFTGTLGPVHALANLVPGLLFERDSVLTTDGYAARRAWSALQKQAGRAKADVLAGLLIVERFDRHTFVGAHEWARRIAMRLGGEVDTGRAWSSSGSTVVRLRLRRGRLAGAACDIVVRDERTNWPADVPLLTVRVTPWSPLHEHLIWLTSGSLATMACVAIVIVLRSDRFVFSLLGGGIVFALVALIAQRLRIGADLHRCEEPMRTLADAARRAVTAP